MKPPENVIIHETEIGIVWFDEDGILCQISKPTTRTIDRMKRHIEFTREISKNQKVCVLADATNAAPPSKEVQEFITTELSKTCLALAILSNSLFGTTMANLLIMLKGKEVPMKMFTDEIKAKKWLKQFLASADTTGSSAQTNAQ